MAYGMRTITEYLLNGQHHVMCYASIKYRFLLLVLDRGEEKSGTVTEYTLSAMVKLKKKSFS